MLRKSITSPWLGWSTLKQQRVVGEVLQSQDRNVSLLTSDSPGPSRVMPGDALFSEVLKQRVQSTPFKKCHLFAIHQN